MIPLIKGDLNQLRDLGLPPGSYTTVDVVAYSGKTDVERFSTLEKIDLIAFLPRRFFSTVKRTVLKRS